MPVLLPTAGMARQHQRLNSWTTSAACRRSRESSGFTPLFRQGTPSTDPRQDLQPGLLITPVLTLWNPYNVEFAFNSLAVKIQQTAPIRFSSRWRARCCRTHPGVTSPSLENNGYDALQHPDRHPPPCAPASETHLQDSMIKIPKRDHTGRQHQTQAGLSPEAACFTSSSGSNKGRTFMPLKPKQTRRLLSSQRNHPGIERDKNKRQASESFIDMNQRGRECPPTG